MIDTLAWASLGATCLPTVLVARNLFLYRPAPAAGPAASASRSGIDGEAESAFGVRDRVSVLIPARDEAASIEASIGSVLEASDAGLELEVLVLDDDSSDGTAELVGAIAQADPRVRLERAPPLPPRWCGKQHACATLATLAHHPLMLFIDADVRLEPGALRRLCRAMDEPEVALLSGFPRQITGTWLERLLIPLIHFVLLGYLPFDGMRHTRLTGFGAGCGQLMLVRRDAYEAVGGHAAIRESLHDGVRLPRRFRACGRRTELVDATDLARCRMYTDAREVWRGLSKNATEGLAAPGVIVPMSCLLLLASTIPCLLTIAGLFGWLPVGTTLVAAGALLLGIGTRLAMARRFRQPPSSALAHPLGIALLLAIQWRALFTRLRGGSASWKGRAYPPAAARPGEGTTRLSRRS